MKKRILSLFVVFAVVLSFMNLTVSASVKNVFDYTLNGYNNKQLNNNWANITLSDTTDPATGIITTTATNSGSLEAGKRIASFQPWEEGQSVGGNAYTMHFGFTVNEITSPVYLEYNYSKDGGSKKELISFSDSRVVVGKGMDGSTYVEVQAPYTIDMFMDISTCSGSIYVNDTLLYQGGMRNSSKDIKWREVRVASLEASTDIKLVTTAASSSIFNESVTFQEVVDYFMNNDVPEDDEETDDGEIVDAGIKDMSGYTLSGYNNKQLNNNWANITLSDSTDSATGIITTTATKSGSLAAGQRIASFQPWEKSKPIYTNASAPYTMHFGFTVNEVTSPLCLSFKYDGGGDKKLISFSDEKVVWGSSMDGNTYIEVEAPYTIDMFMNVQTCKGMIFVNGQVLYDGTMKNTSRFYNSTSDKKWHEVRVVSLQQSDNIKLVTTKANCSIFNENVIFQNVVDYVLNREDAVETDWLWQVEGINLGRELMQGAIDGVSSVTGDNENGYVLTPNSINASHYGFARFFLGTDATVALPQSSSDKILWQSFEYNPTNLTSGQIFEIRGNNAYQTLMTAVPATETQAAYLKVNGNKVCEISADEFYKIDFIVNNKDYEYYILVNGNIATHDVIWDSRVPLWNTVFSSFTMGESMTLKNMKTTVYDNSVSMNDILKKVFTSIHTSIEELVYDGEYGELVVTATMIGNEATFETADLIYVAYDAADRLIAVNSVETYSEDVNTTEFGRAYPYGVLDISEVAEGEQLTIKAFVWDSVSGMKALSDVGEYTYTVPTTVVE